MASADEKTTARSGALAEDAIKSLERAIKGTRISDPILSVGTTESPLTYGANSILRCKACGATVDDSEASACNVCGTAAIITLYVGQAKAP